LPSELHNLYSIFAISIEIVQNAGGQSVTIHTCIGRKPIVEETRKRNYKCKVPSNYTISVNSGSEVLIADITKVLP